ncbi:type II toxin-antitoxin system death-on-curing family toxin [Thermosediminibacter litoriperuensis]
MRNHGFVDGNKRIGIAVMLILLRLNGVNLSYTQKELVELGFAIVDGSINEEDIKEWIIRPLERN